MVALAVNLTELLFLEWYYLAMTAGGARQGFGSSNMTDSFSGMMLVVAMAVRLNKLLFFERYSLAMTACGARQGFGSSTISTSFSGMMLVAVMAVSLNELLFFEWCVAQSSGPDGCSFVWQST